MARISQATLDRSDAGNGVSRMTISFRVHWNETEQNARHSYNLTVQLMGADKALHFGDDQLKKVLGSFDADGQPEQVVEHQFHIATHILNEDWGRDEVYARISIEPQDVPSASADTNIISGRF